MRAILIRVGLWPFDLFTKIGLGITDQQVRIDGVSSLLSPSGNQTAAGGILAQISNMGYHDRQVFSVLPEVGVNVGVDVTQHLRMKAGYSCLFWPNVVRPGALIDRTVNPAQVPTAQEFADVAGPARRWRVSRAQSHERHSRVSRQRVPAVLEARVDHRPSGRAGRSRRIVAAWGMARETVGAPAAG